MAPAWLLAAVAALLLAAGLPAPAAAQAAPPEAYPGEAVPPGAYPGAPGCPPELARSAEAAFREAVRLWKEGRYEALWRLGYLQQQTALPQEDFVRLMRREDRKLQCCWLTLQKVDVVCDGPIVYVRAVMGFEEGGYFFDPAKKAWTFDLAPRDVEEVFRLVPQAGVWRIDLFQVLGPSLLYYEQLPGTTFRFDFPRFPQIDPRDPPARPGR